MLTPGRATKAVGRFDQPFSLSCEPNEYCAVARCERLSDAWNAYAAATAFAVREFAAAGRATAAAGSLLAAVREGGTTASTTPAAMITPRERGIRTRLSMRLVGG